MGSPEHREGNRLVADIWASCSQRKAFELNISPFQGVGWPVSLLQELALVRIDLELGEVLSDAAK